MARETAEARAERLEQEEQERQEEKRIARIVARNIAAQPAPPAPRDRDREPVSERRPVVAPVTTNNNEDGFKNMTIALVVVGVMLVAAFLWLYVMADIRQDTLGKKAAQWDRNDIAAADGLIDVRAKLVAAEAAAKLDAQTKADAALTAAKAHTDAAVTAINTRITTVETDAKVTRQIANGASRKANGDTTLQPQVAALTTRQEADEKRWTQLNDWHEKTLVPEVQRLGAESEAHARFNRRTATHLEAPDLCNEGGCAPPK